MTCMYIDCEYEVAIIFFLVAVIVFSACYLCMYIAKRLRLRQCKVGNHVQYYYLSHGMHGHSTWCECGSSRYMTAIDPF